MKRVLYVCHSHHTTLPGGVETYAAELFRGIRQSGVFEPILLSRIGPPHTGRAPIHSGTHIAAANGDPHQYLFHTDTGDFNWLMLSPRSKEPFTRHFREFLQAYTPDVVHFQHTLFIGFDAVTEAHYMLPNAPIVYTLHEYLPICHREGQMVRADTGERCLEASPRRCNGCFPDIPSHDFFLRKRFIAAHFSRVDRFIAPSRFLLERYVDWGIPRDRIQFEEYGRLPSRRLPEAAPPKARTRFGFFGQLTPFKGVDVLLQAMRLLSETERSDASPHLWIHGANIDFAAEAFKERFRALLDEARANVTFAGQYSHDRLPYLMANVDWVVVPSTWWENSPLVIQEAFAHGRPVICSDIGGMAEKVEHGVNGLHFRAGDPVHLAETIRHAISTPRLWDTLSRNVPAVYPMDEHVANMERLYDTLLQR